MSIIPHPPLPHHAKSATFATTDAQIMAARARAILTPSFMQGGGLPRLPPTQVPPPPPQGLLPADGESIVPSSEGWLPPALPGLDDVFAAAPPPGPPSYLATLPADSSDMVVLVARLADAERHIAHLQARTRFRAPRRRRLTLEYVAATRVSQVELATANERAESFRALAAAKDEIIEAARAQTKVRATCHAPAPPPRLLTRAHLRECGCVPRGGRNGVSTRRTSWRRVRRRLRRP